MLDSYHTKIYTLQQLKEKLVKRQNQTLKIDRWLGLLEKLICLDAVAPEVNDALENAYQSLLFYIQQTSLDARAKKHYYKDYSKLISTVRKHHNLFPKGHFSGLYLGTGIAIGAGVGIALSASNPSFYTLAIVFGLVVGASSGAQKEAQLQKQEKTF
jgi:hypothetical protein